VDFFSLSFRRSADNFKLLTSAAKFLGKPDELKEVNCSLSWASNWFEKYQFRFSLCELFTKKMSRILSDLENEDKKLNRAFTDGILEGIHNNIRWAEKYLEQVYLVIESRIMIGRTTNSLAKTNCIP
jgi:hypothetical protein